MSFGKTLLIVCALLTYLGQSLAYASVACDAMDDVGAQMQHSMDMGSMHTMHEKGAAPAMQHDKPCCGEQCLCVDAGCHSPIPAIVSSGETPLLGSLTPREQAALKTISSPFYLYKPPLSA